MLEWLLTLGSLTLPALLFHIAWLILILPDDDGSAAFWSNTFLSWLLWQHSTVLHWDACPLSTLLMLSPSVCTSSLNGLAHAFGPQ